MPVRTLAAASLLAVTTLLVAAACSGTPEDATLPPEISTPLPTTNPVAQGDTCQDGTGDMLSDVEGEATRTEPAAIDIVEASAKVEGDELAVSLTTVGTMDAAIDPLFLVQQGDVSRAANVSFELRANRASGGSGDWQVRLVTFANGRQLDPKSLPAAKIAVDGNTLSYRVPLRDLPRIATVVWQFGTSSGVSDENRVFDECQPFAQPPDLTSRTTAPPGGPTTTSAPTITGKVGEAIKAPDGSTLTVLQVDKPAQPNRTVLVNPIPQTDLAAIHVKVCAGDKANVDRVGEKRFSVQMADGRSVDPWPAPDHTNDPQFPEEQTLRPGECADGWISYEVPLAGSIASVTYDVGGRSVGPYVVVQNS